MGDRSYDRNESEPKWSRGKLSGQALFGKKLRKYGKKNLFSILGVCNIPETDVMNLELVFLMFNFLWHCKKRENI